MPIEVGCNCGRRLAVPEEYAGRRVKCPTCSAAIAVPDGTAGPTPRAEVAPEPVVEALLLRRPLAEAPQPPPTPKIWEYKVLTQKDKWFSGKFDPERLEQALNAYAAQGWRMKGMASAAFPGMLGGQRDELIFVLER